MSLFLNQWMDQHLMHKSRYTKVVDKYIPNLQINAYLTPYSDDLSEWVLIPEEKLNYEMFDHF